MGIIHQEWLLSYFRACRAIGGSNAFYPGTLPLQPGRQFEGLSRAIRSARQGRTLADLWPVRTTPHPARESKWSGSRCGRAPASHPTSSPPASPPFKLRCIIERTEGDMVHAARAHPPIGELWLHQHVDVIAQRAALCGKAIASAVLANFVRTPWWPARLPSFRSLPHTGSRRRTANRVFSGNVAGTRSFCFARRRRGHDFEAHAIGIGKTEHLLLKPLTRALHRGCRRRAIASPKSRAMSEEHRMPSRWFPRPPGSPRVACGQGKKVRIVPGEPASSPK